MVGPVSPPPDSDGQKPKDDLPQVETGIGKFYSAGKAPSLKKWLEIWFPGHVTDKMVSEFEQNMMKMIQHTIRVDKAQHAKLEQKIKERIDEG